MSPSLYAYVPEGLMHDELPWWPPWRWPLKSAIDCLHLGPARSERCLSTWWWHKRWLMTLRSERGAGITQREDGSTSLPLFQSIILGRMHAHTGWCAHISNCLEYYYSQLAPVSMSTRWLNTLWNITSGIILPLFCSFLGGCVACRPAPNDVTCLLGPY